MEGESRGCLSNFTMNRTPFSTVMRQNKSHRILEWGWKFFLKY